MCPHPRLGYSVNGVKVPGVTTILSRFKESGGLLQWAFQQGRAAERGEIANLYDKRDSAAEAGTLAHSLVEAHIKGVSPPDLSPYPPEIASQATQGYKNYLRWQDDNKIEIVYQEIELVSTKHLYGGCPDAIGRDSRGNLNLLDWKTSNSVYLDHLLQISSYSHLWEENHPDEPLTGGFHLLRFSKEHADFTHSFWSELDDAWEMFLLFRKAYDLDKILKKRV
jgi:hypothetical protein